MAFMYRNAPQHSSELVKLVALRTVTEKQKGNEIILEIFLNIME